jgi:hypothetical protein
LELEGGACVSTDKDGDGIPNTIDQCPDDPEDFNHYKDQDGCPDEPERLATVAAAAKATQERVAAEKAEALAEEAAAAAARASAAEQARREKEAADQAGRRRMDAAEAANRQRLGDEAAAVEERSARSARRTAGFVVGGIGGGLGVTSLVFVGLGAAQNSAVRNGGYANAAAIANADSTGHTYNTVATVTGIVGLVGLLVGGPLLLFNLPASEAATRAAGLALWPSAGGLSLSGAFE